MYRIFFLCLVLLFAHLRLGAATSTAPAVRESDGIVVIQVESAPAIGGWQLRTAVAGYSGTAYYHNGAKSTNAPGSDILEYPFVITRTGTYQVQLRSRIDEGNNRTESNDTFVRLVDASGAEMTPVDNHNDETSLGWHKVYMNKLNAWIWQASNRNHDPKSLAYALSEGKAYKVQLSRRSKGYAVDCIVLWDRSLPTALGNPVTGSVNAAQDAALNTLADSAGGRKEDKGGRN